MIVIVLCGTLDRDAEGIAACLAKDTGLHYNEI
jgi:hypothetical protein